MEKNEAKGEKSLVLQSTKIDPDEDDTEVAYLAKRIVSAMKKSSQFQRSGSSNKRESNVEVCHKCKSSEHFIKDCPLHKMDYQDYLKTIGEKEKNRDQRMKEKEVTLSDIKENLDNYTARKIKGFANVLIDSICELTAEKNALEEKNK
ncbi:uncharacterized protein LOC107879073 [Capsicum annuum]|uniref:uncharacterized protein LOC107879073 n=1 Tax=Capsicum annuum TaxID=4072 RepID=UPI0007BF88BF|nr:uncharacterized protein LOC107879073 [Capsicum annuum]